MLWLTTLTNQVCNKMEIIYLNDVGAALGFIPIQSIEKQIRALSAGDDIFSLTPAP